MDRQDGRLRSTMMLFLLTSFPCHTCTKKYKTPLSLLGITVSLQTFASQQTAELEQDNHMLVYEALLSFYL